MKNALRSLPVMVFMLATAHAQVFITGFNSNGQLTWTNAPGTNAFSLQWSPSINGPWSGTYRSFLSHISTNTQTTIPVPMFYRIQQGFTLATMQGTWMLTGTPENDTFIIAQSDGIISESGMFVPRAPSGYFTVGSDGRVTNTLITTDQILTLPGRFINADQIQPDAPYSSVLMRRVKDATLCQGAWSGTLHQTTPPSSNRTISFTVDNRGMATDLNIQTLVGLGVGRMFALTNTGPNCVGFFYIGWESDNGAYHMISIGGTLTGNTFSGSYFTDSDTITGTVTLTRP